MSFGNAELIVAAMDVLDKCEPSDDNLFLRLPCGTIGSIVTGVRLMLKPDQRIGAVPA